MPFPPVPFAVKSIAHLLKVAEEHDTRNVVVSYWARMHACQLCMKLLPGKKPPDVSALLIALMDWLEQTKKENPDNDGISNETVAQSMIEEYAMQLFAYADGQDRQEIFNKNTIKAFYTAGILLDVLEQFGPLTEEMLGKKKYAKWKAAYIHNCLKKGETPTAGGPDDHLKNVTDTSRPGEENTADDLLIRPRIQEYGYTGPGYNLPSSGLPANFVPTSDEPTTPDPNLFPSTPDPNMYPQRPPITPSTPADPAPIPSSASSQSLTNSEQIQKAQKYCKFATSALNYDDVNTAVENLTKALNLLKFGKEA